MKKYISITVVMLLVAFAWSSCKKDRPVDADGLLITQRQECFVSNFELVGTDFQTVRSKSAVIDTTALTINVEVFFGTDLKNLWPQFTLATDCKLDPKVPGKVDFSDLANPKQFTVVSGNRQIRKTYKINISVQQ